jgi:hypothetical protein
MHKSIWMEQRGFFNDGAIDDFAPSQTISFCSKDFIIDLARY